MKNLSIIQRIALGFAVIILLLVIIVALALQVGQQLVGQINTLSLQIAPTLVQSRSVTRTLFSEDKELRGLLSQDDAAVVRRDKAKLVKWQQQFETDLKQLHEKTTEFPQLQKQIKELTEQQGIYWQQAQQLVDDYASNLEQQAQLHQDAQLAVQGKQFKSDLAMMVAQLGTHYSVGLSRNLNDNLELMIANSLEVLNQHDASYVVQRLDANRQLAERIQSQRKELATALAGQESAFGGKIDFEAALGKKLDVLLADMTSDTGLLSRYLGLTQQSLQLRNQTDQSSRIIDAALDELAQIDKFVDSELQHSVGNTNQVLTRLTSELLIGLGISLALAGFILWRIIIGLRRPLKQIHAVLEALGNGNMTKRIQYRQSDELGHLALGINALADQMRQMLEQVVNSANELGEVAEHNQQVLQQTHQHLEQQRTETASVATAMVEMEHTVADVTKAAHHSMQSVVQVADQANHGREISDSNIRRINQLSTELKASQQVIEEVHGLSVNIGGILDVISQIAEQTNLLALNAAIEAARAGEQGRGFAVVADEVRGLAGRTAQATTEIQAMISALQQSVHAAVNAIRTSSNSMAACTAEGEEASQAMQAISQALQQITDMSSQIAAAAEQQQCTSAEIARNLSNINDIAEKNRGQIDEVAQTSGRLNELSGSQRALVNQFAL